MGKYTRFFVDINMFLIIAYVVVEFMWVITNRKKWMMAIPVFLWMGHLAYFYTLILIGRLEIGSISNSTWSSVIRTQGIATLLALSIYRYKKGRECV